MAIRTPKVAAVTASASVMEPAMLRDDGWGAFATNGHPG